MNNYMPCQIPSLKLSCWGCCGRDFKSKEEIERDIKFNTCDFKQIKTPSTLRLLQFRDRYDEDPDVLTASGICSNLVDFKDGCFACPLHKDINKIIAKDKFLAIHKKDLRVNYCEVDFECETIEIFKKFSEKQKQDYFNFLKKKKLNHYEYSIGNMSGKFIKEFLEKK